MMCGKCNTLHTVGVQEMSTSFWEYWSQEDSQFRSQLYNDYLRLLPPGRHSWDFPCLDTKTMLDKLEVLYLVSDFLDPIPKRCNHFEKT